MFLYILGLIIVLIPFFPSNLITNFQLTMAFKLPVSLGLILLITFYFNFKKKDTIYTTNYVTKACDKRGLFHLFFDLFAVLSYSIGFGYLEVLFTSQGKEDIIKNLSTIFNGFSLKSNESWILILGLCGIILALIFAVLKWVYSTNANKFSLRHRAFIYMLFTCLILAYSVYAFIYTDCKFDLYSYSLVGLNYLFTLIPVALILVIDIVVASIICAHNHKQRKLAMAKEEAQEIATLPLANEEYPVEVGQPLEEQKEDKETKAFKKTNRKQHKIIVRDAKKDKNYTLENLEEKTKEEILTQEDNLDEQPIAEKPLSKRKQKAVNKERKRLEKKISKKEKKLNKKILKEKKRLLKKNGLDLDAVNASDNVIDIDLNEAKIENEAIDKQNDTISEDVSLDSNPEMENTLKKEENSSNEEEVLENKNEDKPLSKKEAKQKAKEDKKQAKLDAKNAKQKAKEDKKQAKLDAKNNAKQAKLDAKNAKIKAKEDKKMAKKATKMPVNEGLEETTAQEINENTVVEDTEATGSNE